ncbi:unnamed protein product [Calypogeia fissa]
MKETKILQVCGTQYGSMLGGLAYQRAEWPEVPVEQENVTLPTISAHLADVDLGSSQIVNEGVNLDVDSQQEPELFQYDDYHKVLKQMYEKMEVNHRLNKIGMTGADKSLKRKESFVDKFMRRGRGRLTTKKKCKEVGDVEAPEREVNAAPFVRIVTMKQSDQAKLDAEALKCIDLKLVISLLRVVDKHRIFKSE